MNAKSNYFRINLIFVLLVSMALGGYFVYLQGAVKQRFESRRWRIPSRIFSETVFFYPGQSFSITNIRVFLEERRYQEAMKEPLQPGQYKIGRETLTVFLRHLKFPGKHLPSQRITFFFAQNRITRITNEHDEIPFLELEPLEIGRIFGPERESRLLVNIKQVPTYLSDAIIAIEDHRFRQHRGIDWYALSRALFADLAAQKVVQGGSTITQQLVKNYFLEPDRSIGRKIQEASLALVIEAYYDKEEILEIYMNEIYMGQRAGIAIHGIGEAAWYYFGKNVEDLNLAESAALAGMIRAPNHYDPLVHPQACAERRNTVLRRMLELGMIADMDYDRARSEPLRTSRSDLPAYIAPYFTDYVELQLRDLYDSKTLASEGLIIYTSLHPEMALAARSAVDDVLDEIEKEHASETLQASEGSLQALLIAVQPNTGLILAIAGGKGYSKDRSTRILNTPREIGSAIAPFIYLSALDSFNPATMLKDEPKEYFSGRCDASAHKQFGKNPGDVSFAEALQRNLESATLRVLLSVDYDMAIKTLQTVGITPPDLPPSLLGIGAFGVKPVDLAMAYAIFANDGQKPFLLTLKEVIDESGDVQERRHVSFETATSAAKAYLMTHLLKGSAESGSRQMIKTLGTEFPCVVYSGISSDCKDSWFIGYTSDLLVLVWLGCEDMSPLKPETANGAARVGTRFVDAVRPWIHPQNFSIPPGIVQRLICKDSGLLATDRCRRKKLETFLEDHVPREYCQGNH